MATGTGTPVTSDALLAEVKTALRITSTTYDAEIATLIDAAQDDLKQGGVSYAAVYSDNPDALIKRAVITYCLAHFGMDNPDSEKYVASYDSLKSHLALSTEYKQPTLTGTTGSITAGASELTVDDADPFAEDDWITVAGAGAGGALLIVRVDSVSGLVLTIDGLAGTTVAAAAVTLA